MKPLVSVIMPVYNAGLYVEAAIKSILTQSYGNIELVIVNDGSQDNSAQIIRSVTDGRIKYFEQENSGVAAALNKALENSSGKYIARQDADDISLPERIAKTVEFLESNPECCIVGAAAEVIDKDGSHLSLLKHPESSAVLKYYLLFDSYFVSSTVLFRREVLAKTGGFYSGADLFEDYSMWSEISMHGKVANLPDVLLKYRQMQSGLSHTTQNSRERVVNQRRRNIQRVFPGINSEMLEAIAWSGIKKTPVKDLAGAEDFISSLVNYLKKNGITIGELELVMADLEKRMMSVALYDSDSKSKPAYYFYRLFEKRAIRNLMNRHNESGK